MLHTLVCSLLHFWSSLICRCVFFTLILGKWIRSWLICWVTLQKDDPFIPHWFYLWLYSGIYSCAIFHTELKSSVKEELLHRNVIFSLGLRFSWVSQRNRGFYSRCGAEAHHYTVDGENIHFLWCLMKRIKNMPLFNILTKKNSNYEVLDTKYGRGL